MQQLSPANRLVREATQPPSRYHDYHDIPASRTTTTSPSAKQTYYGDDCGADLLRRPDGTEEEEKDEEEYQTSSELSEDQPDSDLGSSSGVGSTGAGASSRVNEPSAGCRAGRRRHEVDFSRSSNRGGDNTVAESCEPERGRGRRKKEAAPGSWGKQPAGKANIGGGGRGSGKNRDPGDAEAKSDGGGWSSDVEKRVSGFDRRSSVLPVDGEEERELVQKSRGNSRQSRQLPSRNRQPFSADEGENEENEEEPLLSGAEGMVPATGERKLKTSGEKMPPSRVSNKVSAAAAKKTRKKTRSSTPVGAKKNHRTGQATASAAADPASLEPLDEYLYGVQTAAVAAGRRAPPKGRPPEHVADIVADKREVRSTSPSTPREEGQNSPAMDSGASAGGGGDARGGARRSAQDEEKAPADGGRKASDVPGVGTEGGAVEGAESGAGEARRGRAGGLRGGVGRGGRLAVHEDDAPPGRRRSFGVDGSSRRGGGEGRSRPAAVQRASSPGRRRPWAAKNRRAKKKAVNKDRASATAVRSGEKRNAFLPFFGGGGVTGGGQPVRTRTLLK